MSLLKVLYLSTLKV